jgi:transcriptional regulator with XRE-family HTH domain
MDNYVTGNTIKKLREKNNLTQLELANKLNVSDKTISKWETGRGLPDISLIDPLSKALNISITELFSGSYIINRNMSGNMLQSKIYVCPICGNIIHTIGETLVSCCGITLPILEPEEIDDEHFVDVAKVENDYYIKINHSMNKKHYISFIAYVTSNKFELYKLYAEQNAEARFNVRGKGFIYIYCNKHGLFKYKI